MPDAFLPPLGFVRFVGDITYYGHTFCGWQKQVQARTVQGQLETTLSRLFKQPIRVHGASRTDAGVHALHQVFHFDAPAHVPCAGVLRVLNGVKNAGWKINSLRIARQPFHARYSARAKTYVYYVDDQHCIDPFAANRVWLLGPPKLSVGQLRNVLTFLEGTHDFLSFCIEAKKDTVRTLQKVRVTRKNNLIKITLCATGFLRGMVRMIVGSAINQVKQKTNVNLLAAALKDPRKGSAGIRAPASGLYLARVHY